MKDNRDDPRFVGQTAGVIAMISALVKSLPPSNRKRLLRQTQVEFELLLGAMPAGTSQAQTEREVVEWMRDLFLKRIAETDSEQNPRRKPQAPKHAGQPGVSDKRSEVLAPPPTGVDIEL